MFIIGLSFIEGILKLTCYSVFVFYNIHSVFKY